MVIVGGARAITNGSAIDEPRRRPFRGALPTAERTAQCGPILTGEVNAKLVDFVAHCVSCYGFDECGGRNRASRSTKHFQEIHGVIGIEMAAHRCFWRGGQRHCASDSFRGYREYGFPEDYRTGSSRCWEEMDREGWVVDARRRASTSCSSSRRSSVVHSNEVCVSNLNLQESADDHCKAARLATALLRAPLASGFASAKLHHLWEHDSPIRVANAKTCWVRWLT
jgi:hypothetical protein